MNHARIAQEAADKTGLPHYVGRFHDGYRMQSTSPQVLIELGAIAVETYTPEGWSYDLIQREPEPEPYVEPAPQWKKAAIYAFGAIWCLAVWSAVLYAAYRIF